MPISNALPAITDDPTKTIKPSRVIFAFLPTSGVQVNFSGKIKDRTIPEPSKVERKTYNPTTKLIEVSRTVYTEVEAQGFTITLDEPKNAAVLALINARQQAGTGRLFVQDPADVANKVALLSNEFNCVVVIAGESMTDTEFMSHDLKVTINGNFTWTADATVT